MGACISCIKSNPQSKYIMSATDLLERIDPKTVPKVPFQDKIIFARIEEIYDGDTVKIIVLFGETPVKLSLRILGIDTPEIKHAEGRLPEEHVAAVKVRDYMRSLFPKNIAKICIRDWDKYGGRILGELFLETGENVAEILIHGGWARPYRGEKKKPWTLEELMVSPFVN
jgi:micrococcal nuclease